MDPKDSSPSRVDVGALGLTTLLIAAVLVGFGFVAERHPDLHYRIAQEDELMEWATFWCFLLAAIGFAAIAQHARRDGRPIWYLVGLALFAAVVAFEEISWGQRVLGFRPPDYFLEENFQQELNFHNVMSTSLRKLALQGVLLGWGVALPLLAQIPAVGDRLGRLGIVAPPLAVVPGMAGAWFTYNRYPWKYTGEPVELALGLAMLAAAVIPLVRAGSARRMLAIAAAAGLSALLGGATMAVTQRIGTGSAEVLALAEQEALALSRDLRSLRGPDGSFATRCGTHRRVYTQVVKKRIDALHEGRFADRVEQGMPEDRARYFLDPWNNPWWVRDRCEDDTRRRVIFVYSFGPNRRRDSTRWEIRGDDVGVFVADIRPR